MSKSPLVDLYRANHRKLGLCIHCLDKVSRGGLCQKHYDANRAASAKSYRKLHGVGVRRCGNCHEAGHYRTRCQKPVQTTTN